MPFPSVQFSEQDSQSPAADLFQANPSAIGGFVGPSDQGPVVPTVVSSWAQFVSAYGRNYTSLHYAVSDFFNNGGSQALVTRLPGADAEAATVDIEAVGAEVSDPPIFTVTALSPGTWGNNLHVVVYPRDATAGRFDIALFNVPAGITLDVAAGGQYRLERWNDLSLSASDPRYVYDIVNAPSSAGSRYISISGLSQAPGGDLYPVTAADNALVDGSNGTYAAPDFVAETAYTSAVTAMLATDQSLVINLPGITDPDTIEAVVSAAAEKGTSFVVIDPPLGDTASELADYPGDLGLTALTPQQQSYAGVWAPALYLPSLTGASGRTVLRGPGGAVVGLMLAVDSSVGVWRAPAGTRFPIRGASQVETEFTDAELSLLNDSHVNVIRPIRGYGIVPMGARTVKRYGQDRYVNNRRNMIYIRESLMNVIFPLTFEPNDNRLWNSIHTACDRFLMGHWQRGGLKGGTAREAYRLVCDSTNNPPQTAEAGEVNVTIAVAVSAPAEFININLSFAAGELVSSSIES
jgi:hypothetical protein